MKTKMYIAVLDEVPTHMVPVLVAHTVLGAHQVLYRYEIYQYWLNLHFYKVVVKVNRKEFDKISNLDRAVYLGHEMTVLEGTKSCAVVLPYRSDEELPNVLKFAKLWSPNESK